jgi:hypothetical protein
MPCIENQPAFLTYHIAAGCRLSWSQGHNVAGSIGSIEKYNYLIGNRTCDLLARSIVLNQLRYRASIARYVTFISLIVTQVYCWRRCDRNRWLFKCADLEIVCKIRTVKMSAWCLRMKLTKFSLNADLTTNKICNVSKYAYKLSIKWSCVYWKNSVALPTEQPPQVGEVSANFLG